MTKKYRPNVGICLINKDNLIFSGKRVDIIDNNCWQMPQGGVDDLDDDKILIQGLYKELHEETGLQFNSVEILGKSPKVKYDFSDEVLKKHKKNDFIGQEQIWFYLKFLGIDDSIDIFQDQNPEFCDWKWSTRDFLLENITTMKKNVYKTILNSNNFEKFIL